MKVPGPLILASASPQRRKLLKALGIPFRVIPSRVSERSGEKNPRRLVIELARRKALSVLEKNPRAVVLGADTIVVCAGRIIGKPKDLKDSKRILNMLNGRWHRVYTGVALAREGRLWSQAAVSKVLARRLDKEELATLAGKHMDKAGAYAVQDREDPFITRVEGDLDNVVGLPLKTVKALMRASTARD